ncbi:hypothetical protein [Nostoc sp.]
MSTPPNLSPQQINAFPQQETITGVVERLRTIRNSQFAIADVIE